MSAVASQENTKVCSSLVFNGAPKSIKNKYDTPTGSGSTNVQQKLKTEISRI